MRLMLLNAIYFTPVLSTSKADRVQRKWDPQCPIPTRELRLRLGKPRCAVINPPPTLLLIARPTDRCYVNVVESHQTPHLVMLAVAWTESKGASALQPPMAL